MQPGIMRIESTTLIFDLDGTLSDPSLGICRCFNFALESHGFDGIPVEVIAAEIGPPLDETFHKLAPGVSGSVVGSLIAKYRERYDEVGYSENQVYPGMTEAISRLSGAGVRLGVCTSKRRDFAEKILGLFDLLPYFAFVDGGDVGVKKGKQLRSLLRAGTIEHDSVMIGDRAVDVLAAKSNQLRSIGVLWGFGSSRELAAAGPDWTVANIDDLTQLLIQP